jgi:hypothetical protein
VHLINPYRLQSRNKGRTKGSHKRNATSSYFFVVDFLRIFLIAAELDRSVAAIEGARLCRSAKVAAALISFIVNMLLEITQAEK